MQIVLTQDVQHLGRKGDMKAVKAGYFRNFLAPRGKAIRASDKLLAQLLEQKRQRDQRKGEMLAKADEMVKKIEKMTVTFTQKATPKGKLYASINEVKIQHQLEKALRFDLDKEAIILPEHIKALGEYEATIQLTPTAKATLKIVVKAA